MSRRLRWLGLHFAAIAVGVHFMAAAVDANDPRAARTVFLVLMGMGAGVGWLARALFEHWLHRGARLELCACGHTRNLHRAYPIGDPDSGCMRCSCKFYEPPPPPTGDNLFGVESFRGEGVRVPCWSTSAINKPQALNLAAHLVLAAGGDLEAFTVHYQAACMEDA